MTRSENVGDNEVSIVRGKVDSLSLYEITDHELDVLEKGSPSSIYLNFSIFLASIGASFLITIFSVEIHDDRVFISFVIFAAIGAIGGLFLLILWYNLKSSVSDVVEKIKGRIAD
jgi:hypothetical protein